MLLASDSVVIIFHSIYFAIGKPTLLIVSKTFLEGKGTTWSEIDSLQIGEWANFHSAAAAGWLERGI
jgi:hypothetical protein